MILLYTIIFSLGLIALFKKGLLLPMVLAYSVVPLRTWLPESHIDAGILRLGIDSAISFIIIFLIAIRLLFSSLHGKSFSYISWTIIFGLIAFVSSMVMAVLGHPAGIKMFMRILFPIMIFLHVLSEYQKEESQSKIINIYIYIGLAASFASLVLHLSGYEVWKWSAGIMRYSGLGSISDYAYLMACMSVLVYVKIIRQQYKIRAIGYAILTVFFVQLLFTVTRGAIFAAIIGILAVELYNQQRKIHVKAIALTLIAMTFVMSVFIYEPLRARIFGTNYKDITTSQSASKKLEGSFEKSGRKLLWGYVFDTTLHDYHIITGHGIGQSEDMFIKAIGNVPHNEYIRVFFEMGLMGLVIFLLLLHQLWRLKRFDTSIGQVRKLMFVGIFSVYISGALVDNMLNKYKNMGMPMYMFAAFLVLREKHDHQKLNRASNENI